MKPKTAKIIYWTLTILFALFMLMDGISGIAQVEAGKESMRQLGYPIYLMSILGVAKVLGALTLLQNKFQTFKEWAYAGFVINVLGAALSWIFVGGPAFNIILPLIFLGIILFSYFLWKKYIKIKNN